MTDTKTIAWSFWDLLNQGQLEQALDVLDDTGTWWECRMRQAYPMSRHKQGMREGWSIMPLQFALHRVQALEDGALLLEVESRGTTAGGHPYNNVYCYIVTVRGDHILHVREYADTQHTVEGMPSAMVATFRERMISEDRAAPLTDKIKLAVDGPIAVITNNNPGKHNAFDDEMDIRLFEILAELRQRRDVRAVIWRGEGASWSSGRDVSTIGRSNELTHHELMVRGHRGIQQIFDLDAPIIAAIQGWAIGGSFQRALLCDIRVGAEGSRYLLPEVGHGVIPDTGGVARLFQICGPGVVSDLVLTGRPLDVEEAYAHGIVSRVVPRDQLDDIALEMAHKIASSPAVTVKMARRVLQRLSEPQIRSSMGDEVIYQTFVNGSDDFVEFKTAREERRAPHYTGS